MRAAGERPAAGRWPSVCDEAGLAAIRANPKASAKRDRGQPRYTHVVSASVNLSKICATYRPRGRLTRAPEAIACRSWRGLATGQQARPSRSRKAAAPAITAGQCGDFSACRLAHAPRSSAAGDLQECLAQRGKLAGSRGGHCAAHRLCMLKELLDPNGADEGEEGQHQGRKDGNERDDKARRSSHVR